MRILQLGYLICWHIWIFFFVFFKNWGAKTYLFSRVRERPFINCFLFFLTLIISSVPLLQVRGSGELQNMSQQQAHLCECWAGQCGHLLQWSSDQCPPARPGTGDHDQDQEWELWRAGSDQLWWHSGQTNSRSRLQQQHCQDLDQGRVEEEIWKKIS